MNVQVLRQDLMDIYQQSNVRGLKQSCKWSTELLCTLLNQETIRSKCLIGTDFNNTFEQQQLERKTLNFNYLYSDCDYLFAKSVFDLGEYERTAYFTQHYQNHEVMFLHFYSKYLAYEKERLDRMVEPSSVIAESSITVFIELRKMLEHLFSVHSSASGDAYMNYLHGIILFKLGLISDAIVALVKSVTIDPLCWCSWHQLSQVIDDESQLSKLQLPDHWLKHFFLACVYTELQLNENAVGLYEDLLSTFTDSNYIRTQLGIVRNNIRDFDNAINLFLAIRASDPYRLDSMDIYSNLLYVKDMQAELSSLAHLANKIDPFRVETCYCIANFYSRRGQHAKSIIYLSRALQLNPKHLSAWTLMGHEYVELKNAAAAIQAYRSAVRCQKRDFRAWHGLGLTYEILKMPAYSVYYYSMAHFYQPNDTRLIMALGHTYEKLARYSDAANCFTKAGFSALTSLAKLYEKLNENHKAAAVYNEFVNQFEEKQAIYNLKISDLTTAYRYLANYFLKYKKYSQAQVAAQMCMHFPETRDEAKEILNKLQQAMNVSATTTSTTATTSSENK